MKFNLKTPNKISETLAVRLKHLRLLKKWKRATLAERSGVTNSSLRRFEDTGKISMDNFLKLLNALGRLDEMDLLLKPPVAQSIEELKRYENQVSKRGRI